jgi:hypothetical protein
VAGADRDRVGEEEQVERVVDADKRIVAHRELDAVLIDSDGERVALVEARERDAAAGVRVVEGDIDLAEQAAEGVERRREGKYLDDAGERDAEEVEVPRAEAAGRGRRRERSRSIIPWSTAAGDEEYHERNSDPDKAERGQR